VFANPIFLYAILAGAVPILVHLIFRRRRTAMDYPTLMFFKRVDMKLASRRKLKEIVLLSLRAAAIIFFALALARPGFKSGSESGSASADCVIVLDNSATMGISTSVGTRLEAARSRAAGVIAAMGAEGRAAIVTTVHSDAVMNVSSLTGDRGLLQKSLEAVAPTSGSGSIAAAVSRAQQILEQSSSAPNREIYVISDFQAVPFKDEAALKSAAGAIPTTTSVFFCAVGGGTPETNLAITGITTDPRPKVAGRRVTLNVKVKNPSRREISTTVSAGLRQQPLQQSTVTLQPGAVQDVPLTITLGQEGLAAGEAKLDADDAAFDNVWPFALDVRGPIRVLVVSPGAKKAELEDSFYLRKALDPTGDGRLSGIRVTFAPEASAPTKLDGFDAIVLCAINSLPPAALSAISDFAERGGGVLVFGGPADAKLADKHPLRALTAVRALGIIEPPRDQPPLSLKVTHPAAPYFDDSRITDGRVEFPEIALLKAVRVEPDKDANVLAEFGDGSPAVTVRNLGKGRVMYWSLRPHADDGNLPLMPSFLSLLHCSVSVLSNAQGINLERKAGQPLQLDFSSAAASANVKLPAAVTVFDPEEKSVEVTIGSGRLTFRSTGGAGVYRISALTPDPAPTKGEGRRDAVIPAGFAVVPDPEESAPEYLSAADALKAFPVANGFALAPGAELAPLLSTARQGRELFGLFLLLALLMVLAEAMLANAIGARVRSPMLATGQKKGVGADMSGLNLKPVARNASPEKETPATEMEARRVSEGRS